MQIQINRALFERPGDRTFVLVAHKLVQLRSCGRMRVLGGATVRELGSLRRAPGFRGKVRTGLREKGRRALQRITTQIP